jgi:deoxycytidylate deaminase
MNSKFDMQFFEMAGEEAKKSLCLRDKCGALVVLDGNVIGRGYNGPPTASSQKMCTREYSSSKKPKSDKTCCVHAEWRAIMECVRLNIPLQKSILYFTRVDESGNLLYSGDPYCTVCSRLALDVGIGFFALYHESGIRLYTTDEYNILSYDFYK